MPNEIEDQSEEIVEQTEEEAQSEYDKVFYADEGEENADEGEEESLEESNDGDQQDNGEELPEPEGDEEAGEDAGDENPDENPDEGDDVKEQPEEKPEMVTLKWRGKEIEVTQEEAINMAQQNFDITHKYQEVASMRKSAERDLDLIEKIKSGDKKALARLAKSGDIDPVDLLDIDMDDIEQGSSDQEQPFVSPEVDALMQEVAKDDELYNALSDMEQSLPSPVVAEMAKDVNTFYAIVNEVKSGDAGVVMPRLQAQLAQLDAVDRAVVMNNADAFANFYVNVKQSLIDAMPQPEATEEIKQTKTRSNVNPAEVATRRSNTQKRGEPKQLDSMHSDEAYEKILNRLANSQ